ncbi:MAG TPA: hypothetical protein PKC15_13965, partial [Rhodocyclaceae bacterium]|nr:hypothetical protein [Rhodocyclaceae bacterium]
MIIHVRIVLVLLVLGGGAILGRQGLAQSPPDPGSRTGMLRVADVEVDRVQLERRLESVGILVDRSSGAKQIESVGEPRALERRAKARDLYRQAQEAFRANDLMRASRLLTESSVTMFEAVRLAAPEKVAAE